MLEAAAEFDDDLMEAYLEGEEIKEEQIIHAFTCRHAKSGA